MLKKVALRKVPKGPFIYTTQGGRRAVQSRPLLWRKVPSKRVFVNILALNLF